jgi:hypothetical protein
MLKDARVVYFVRDFNNNITYDTILYAAPVFVDTMPPVTNLLSSNRIQWKFGVSENRNIPPLPVNCPKNGQQRDSGIVGIILGSESVNLRLQLMSGTSFPPDSMIVDEIFYVFVVDTTKSAFGIVTSKDRAGNSTKDTIRFEFSTSVRESESIIGQLTVTPNPATDQCLVSWADRLRVRFVEVLDLQGKVVISQQVDGVVTEVMIDVRPLPKGSYTARLTGPEGSATQRFIVR